MTMLIWLILEGFMTYLVYSKVFMSVKNYNVNFLFFAKNMIRILCIIIIITLVVMVFHMNVLTPGTAVSLGLLISTLIRIDIKINKFKEYIQKTKSAFPLYFAQVFYLYGTIAGKDKFLRNEDRLTDILGNSFNKYNYNKLCLYHETIKTNIKEMLNEKEYSLYIKKSDKLFKKISKLIEIGT